MTVQLPVNDRVIRLTPAAGTTILDTDFPVLAAADLAVWRERGGVASLLTLNTDYTLSLVGNQGGARVTLAVASLAGDAYALRGARPRSRTSSLIEGQLRSDDLNGEFAALLASIQELGRDVDLAMGPTPNNPAGPLTAGGRGIDKSLYLDIETTAASTPAAGRGRLQARASTGTRPKLYWRGPDGDEVELSAGGDASASAAASAASASAAAASASAAAISAATINLPNPSGNANKVIAVNSAGNGYTLVTGGGDVTTAQLTNAIDGLKGGVSAALDSFAEVETALAKAVQVDEVQSFTLAEVQQGRSNASAAPIGAMAFGDIVVNGSHLASQENADAAITGEGYATDQWRVDRAGTMATSVQRVTDAPPGYTYSLRTTITTAQASLSSGNYLRIRQPIEQIRVKRFELGTANARSFLIGFWVKSSVAGTYGVTVHDWNGTTPTQSWVGSVVIAQANTWEFKTFLVPTQTAGTWGTSATGHAMSLSIAMACASNLVGAAGWQSGNYYGVTGQQNLAATLNATFSFTGVFALPDTAAVRSDSAWTLQRHLHDELLLCKRYWSSSSAALDATGGASNFTANSFPWPVQMRAIPSITAAPSANIGNSTIGFEATASGVIAYMVSTNTGRAYWYGNAIANARL